MNDATSARTNGVTLTEMVVVMGIIALLLAIGVPMYMNIATDDTVTSAVEKLSNTMRRAQSEAIVRKQRVRFRYNADYRLCYVIPESGNPNAASDDDLSEDPAKNREAAFVGEPLEMPVGPRVWVDEGGALKDEESYDHFEVWFSSDGSVADVRVDETPSMGAALVVVHPEDGNIQTTIRLVPATGRITIE